MNDEEFECNLYDRCLQMSSSYNVVLETMKSTKQRLDSIEESERVARVSREETVKKIDTLDEKLDTHLKNFQLHSEEEMQNLVSHTKAMEALAETLNDLHESHTIEKQDQKWLKLLGYGMGAIFGSALIWLFLNVNDILKLAFRIGFTGIGVNQKGDKRFIHLDLREFPLVYSY
jgi:hypothetical protein